jgi:mannose-6-phosphate isomerase-like protein (cupin superfamily)
MLIKKLSECKEIISGDKCILRELINPLKDDTAIRYSLAHAKVEPGEKSVPHKLKNTELYYIMQGEGVMHIDKETAEVKENDAVYIPPNAVQYIENTGEKDLVFLAIVDPPWCAEEEEIL